MSRKQLLHLFVICAFPVHVWAIIGLFDQFPAWILRNSLWEIAGMSGYILGLALFESVLVYLFVWAGVHLAGRWLGDRTVAVALVVVWLISLFSMVAHVYERILFSPWGLLIGAGFIAAGGAGLWGVFRWERFVRGIQDFVERLVVLSAFYIFLDGMGVIVVLIRNLG